MVTGRTLKVKRGSGVFVSVQSVFRPFFFIGNSTGIHGRDHTAHYIFSIYIVVQVVVSVEISLATFYISSQF